MRKPKLVTKDSLQTMCNSTDPRKLMQVVGRALLALYSKQTLAEQAAQTTYVLNNVGFSGCDAEIGSSHARFYQERGYLTPKQMNVWLKKKANGYCRLSRYHRQLNTIAVVKAAEKQERLVA